MRWDTAGRSQSAQRPGDRITQSTASKIFSEGRTLGAQQCQQCRRGPRASWVRFVHRSPSPFPARRTADKSSLRPLRTCGFHMVLASQSQSSETAKVQAQSESHSTLALLSTSAQRGTHTDLGCERAGFVRLPSTLHLYKPPFPPLNWFGAASKTGVDTPAESGIQL